MDAEAKSWALRTGVILQSVKSSCSLTMCSPQLDSVARKLAGNLLAQRENATVLGCLGSHQYFATQSQLSTAPGSEIVQPCCQEKSRVLFVAPLFLNRPLASAASGIPHQRFFEHTAEFITCPQSPLPLRSFTPQEIAGDPDCADASGSWFRDPFQPQQVPPTRGAKQTMHLTS